MPCFLPAKRTLAPSTRAATVLPPPTAQAERPTPPVATGRRPEDASVLRPRFQPDPADPFPLTGEVTARSPATGGDRLTSLGASTSASLCNRLASHGLRGLPRRGCLSSRRSRTSCWSTGRPLDVLPNVRAEATREVGCPWPAADNELATRLPAKGAPPRGVASRARG